MRCDQFTLKRSLRQTTMSEPGGIGPDQQGTAENAGEEGRQGEEDGARPGDDTGEGGHQGGQMSNLGPVTPAAVRTATSVPNKADTSTFWRRQGTTRAEDDQSAMEYSDALMADWARIMGRIQEVELGAWAS